MELNSTESQLRDLKKKTMFLVLICLVVSIVYWKLIAINLVGNEIRNGVGWPIIPCPFLFGIFYFTAEKKTAFTNIVGVLLAVSMGILLGAVSGIFDRQLEGLVIQAIFATFASAFSLLFLYKNKFIKVNSSFMQFTSYMGSSLLFIFCFDSIMRFIDLSWQPLFSLARTSGLILLIVILILSYAISAIDLSVIEETFEREAVDKNQVWFFAIELLIDVVWVYAVLFLIIGILRGKRK